MKLPRTLFQYPGWRTRWNAHFYGHAHVQRRLEYIYAH